MKNFKINKLRNVLFLGIRRPNMVKILVLPKPICKLKSNQNSNRIFCFLVEIKELIFKLLWQYKGPAITKANWKRTELENCCEQRQIAQWKGGKKISQVNYKKINYTIQTGQMTWTDTAPKKVYKWPINTWKDAPYHYSFGEFNFKLQIELCSYCNRYN